MRALVTGAGGFVGTHLCRHLADAGDDVVGLTSAVDVADGPAVAEAVAAAEPEVVYHLAALSHVGDSFEQPAEVVRVNVAGTAAVCDAARRAGVRRVVVVGSSDAYGRVPAERLPIGEDEPLRPVSPYGASKAAAEVVALQAMRAHGVEVVLTRSFNHTGPGQAPTFVVPGLAGRLAAARRDGRDQVPVGNLDAARDILDVEDVVRAYRGLAVAGEPGSAYNVCSGRAVTVQELADRLVALAGGAVHLVTDPALVRPVEVPVVVGSNDRLRRDTGWEPTVDLDTTLRRVWAAAGG